MNANDAQRALWKAQEAERNLKSERHRFIEDRLRERRKELEVSASALFDQRIRREAAEAVALAHDEHDRLTEEEALAKDFEIPAGTRMMEMTRPFRLGPLHPTRRRGLLEVITRSSAHPASLPEFRRASIGEPVIRLLKKDGTPSRLYVKGWPVANRWFPENQE